MARTQKIKIINILLASIDGKIATHNNESSAQRRALRFTNSDDFKHMQKLTSTCDAVLIGARTLHSELGAFRVAHLRKNKTEPHWFILTKSGHINYAHPFWNQKNIPKSVVHLNDAFSLFDFVKSLEQQKMKRVALLGGGELNGLFWTHNLVSDLHLTVSPRIIGALSAPNLINTAHSLHTKLRLSSIDRKRSFLFLHYKVIK